MSKPNLIMFLIDDMGWRDVSCYGSAFYETPNIDRLAREGMRFTNAYAACPVCSPTRASMLSGKYPARVGVTNYIGAKDHGKLAQVPYVDHLPPAEHSLAAALRDGGYQTWHVGKWHLGAQPYWPENHGFDVNVGGWDAGRPAEGYFAPWGFPNLEDPEPGTHLDTHLTDHALRLLRERDDARPFFLNFWFYLVHTPLQAPTELVAKYERKAHRLGLDRKDPFEQGEPFPCSHKRDQFIVRRRFQSDPTYAAMIELLDTNIGRVLDALDELGLSDDTVVCFTSDNGGLATAEGSPTCNAPLVEGKGWMYEGGTREPLIVRKPGEIQPGGVSDALVTSPDFYPTFLELAGLDPIPQQHVDGRSFVPALHGRDFDRGPIYWHYPHYGNQGGTPTCAVREGDWKLIEFFEDGRVELYNLREDISESVDRAADEPAVRDRLHERLKAWRKEIDAIIPQPDPAYTASTEPTADPTI